MLELWTVDWVLFYFIFYFYFPYLNLTKRLWCDVTYNDHIYYYYYLFKMLTREDIRAELTLSEYLQLVTQEVRSSMETYLGNGCGNL